MREKRWEERGPKAHSKNSALCTPVILVLFSGLATNFDLITRFCGHQLPQRMLKDSIRQHLRQGE